MLEALAAGLLKAVRGGDLAAARVAHDAIGRLLGAEGEGHVEGARVVDLSEHRGRRGGAS
jgi:hypothetical protein